MVHQLLLLVIVFSLSHSISPPNCTGPVTFNSININIKGPCPDSTVIAPVGSTVQYRCDYEDGTEENLAPYWHIAGLSGTPFIQGTPGHGEHNIKISKISAGFYTIITIPILEQYLNNTLNIQCGLCSVPSVCYDSTKPTINRLRENITSSMVELITFDTPRQLVSIVTNDIVTLQWLPPVFSNQTCLNCFIYYNIHLINNNNESQIIQFNTTDTEVNITRLNITEGFDTCSNYSWNVTAIHNASNSASQAASADNNILLQSEPNITSKVNYYLKEDNETATEELIVNFTISTLQPLDTLTYRVCVNYSDGYRDCHSQPNITVTAQNGTTVELDVPLTTANINITDLCVIVFVSNECGNDSNFLSLNCQKSLSSLISSDQISPTNSIVTEITSSIQFSLATMSVSHDPFPGFSPSSTVQQKNTNLSITIIIIIPIIIIVIFVIILIPILIIVVCAVCCKKKRYAISNKRQEDVDSSTDNQINGLEYTAVTLSQTVSDYLTPTEAITAVNTYQSLQTDSAAENSENQYCEPEKLRSTISRTSSAKRLATTDWNSTELQDIAGYCVPPNQIVNNSKKATLLAAKLSVEDPSVPMYADINEIKARKLAKNDAKYASLDLPSTPETPPPLPPHRDVTYSKIIQEDIGSYTPL